MATIRDMSIEQPSKRTKFNDDSVFPSNPAIERVALSSLPSINRPKPTFSSVPPTTSTHSLVCPATPQRKTPSSDFEMIIGVPFSVEKWDGSGSLHLTAVRKLGSGDHGTAWLVKTEDGAMRVYKRDLIFSPSCIKEELYQYAQLKKIRFPVAVYDDLEFFLQMKEFQYILNMPNKGLRDAKLSRFVKAHIHHPYHLRQYVENPFPEYQQEPENCALYTQLKEMMSLAYQHRIAADLQKNNIGYERTTEGVRALYYDLMPHDEVSIDSEGWEREDENPFGLIANICLKTFAPEGSSLFQRLDPRTPDKS